MHGHLAPLIAIFLILISWLIEYRRFLRTRFAHLITKSNIAKRKRRNKSLPYPLSTLHKAIILFPCKVEKLRALAFIQIFEDCYVTWLSSGEKEVDFEIWCRSLL